jgi:3'(2'), 5'-bisphosphate nucleotidase
MADIREPAELLQRAVTVAREAGREILAIYAQDFSVEHKDDRSPLTAADMAAHHAILDGLQALTPGVPILSEEEADVPYGERATWRRYWLVDPLDGTREFIKRNGEFTVNIALIEDHEPVLGVIHVPVGDVCYFAARGAGALRQGLGEATREIHASPWAGGHITIAGSRSHRDPRFDRFLAQFDDYTVVSMGSSLKSCLVAEGRADVYLRLGPTSEWDTAAAQCIVEEAGGVMLDTALQPLRYNTKASLLNPYFIVCGDAGRDWGKYLAPCLAAEP